MAKRYYQLAFGLEPQYVELIRRIAEGKRVSIGYVIRDIIRANIQSYFKENIKDEN